MNRTFTVIVPMYNVQDYIAECIESVINQTYPLWELIVVDDESTDNSLDIARQYEQNDKRIKVIAKQHGGLPHTRNHALHLAAGDYITLLDGDDYFASDHLERCNQVLSDNCDMCIINNHINFTRKIQKKITLFPYYDGINDLEKKDKLNMIFSLNNRLPASAVLTVYRRKFLSDNNLAYNETYRCSEDLDFFLQNLVKADIIQFSDHEFYYYRQDNIGAMTKNLTSEMLFDRLSIYEKWYRHYKDNMINGFDGNNALKLLKRDMRSSVILLHQITVYDGNRKKLKTYIKRTGYIWAESGFKNSYIYNMIIYGIWFRMKRLLNYFKRFMKRLSGKHDSE